MPALQAASAAAAAGTPGYFRLNTIRPPPMSPEHEHGDHEQSFASADTLDTAPSVLMDSVAGLDYGMLCHDTLGCLIALDNVKVLLFFCSPFSLRRRCHRCWYLLLASGIVQDATAERSVVQRWEANYEDDEDDLSKVEVPF